MRPAETVLRPNLPVAPDPALAVARLVAPPGSSRRGSDAPAECEARKGIDSEARRSSPSPTLKADASSAPTPSASPSRYGRLRATAGDPAKHDPIEARGAQMLPRAALHTASTGWHLMASSPASSPDPKPIPIHRQSFPPPSSSSAGRGANSDSISSSASSNLALPRSSIESTLSSLPPLSAGSSEGTLRLFASRASVALRCVLFALRQSEARCSALQMSSNRAAGRLLEISQSKDLLERDLQELQRKRSTADDGSPLPASSFVSLDRVALAELRRRLALAERDAEERPAASRAQHKEIVAVHQQEIAEIACILTSNAQSLAHDQTG